MSKELEKAAEEYSINGDYQFMSTFQQMALKAFIAGANWQASNTIILNKMYPKLNKKVYYRGAVKRGDEIIKALKELGGQNSNCFNGTSKYSYYFISKNDVIGAIPESDRDAVFLLQQFYTEAFLPEEPKEAITIGNDTYEVTEELKAALKNLKKI